MTELDPWPTFALGCTVDCLDPFVLKHVNGYFMFQLMTLITYHVVILPNF